MKLNSLSKKQLIADIAHAEEKATTLCGPCADDHARLAVWLRALLAAHEQEPVAFRDRKEIGGVSFAKGFDYGLLPDGAPLYARSAPSIPDVREAVRQAHAEWSQATFGNVGPLGPLKHLAKEALEAAAEPGDLSEWADCQFLLWDAQRRAGITDEQIARACAEKLEVNKARTWPEPKDGEPRQHICE